MFYRGKYFDLFEAALQMQFVNFGMPCIYDIDVISMRCCHYVFEENCWENCIHSNISLEQAIVRINNKCFSQGGIQCIHLKNITEMKNKVQAGDVVGPIKANKIFKNMQSECFSGQTKYLYCCSINDGYYKWHCAYEYPFLLKSLEELWDDDDIFIIRVLPSSILYGTIDAYLILKESINYQIEERIGKTELIPLRLVQGLKRKQKIALQLGLYNYLLQTNKYVSFLEKAIQYSMPGYDILLAKLYQSVRDIDITSFNNNNNILREKLLEVEKWKN